MQSTKNNNTGPPPPDTITYSLVAGLLELGDKHPQHYEKIISTLWKYAECIIQLMSENGTTFFCLSTY
jgi:phosphatidylinositol 4-kinase